MSLSFLNPKKKEKDAAKEDMLAQRKKSWPDDDKKRLEEATSNGKDVSTTYFGRFTVEERDEAELDMARIFEKILSAFDYESQCKVLHGENLICALVEEAVGFGKRPQDPTLPDGPTLSQGDQKFWRTRVKGRRKQLKLSVQKLDDGVVEGVDIPTLTNRFRMVAVCLYMEMVELMYLCRFVSGDDLVKELSARTAWFSDLEFSTSMDMAKTAFIYQGAAAPVLFQDFDTGLSPPSCANPHSAANSSLTPQVPTAPPLLQDPQRGGPPPLISNGLYPSVPSEAFSRFSQSTVPVGAPVSAIPSAPPSSTTPPSGVSETGGGPVQHADSLALRFPHAAPLKPVNRGPDNLEATLKSVANVNPPTQTIVVTQTPAPMKLPTFYGNHSEFPGFWELFSHLVDSNPSVPDITKLFQLKSVLKGRAEYLAAQVGNMPSDYPILKDLLVRGFSNNNAAFQEITTRMKEWPRLKEGQYQSLASFTGFACQYVSKLLTIHGGRRFNALNVMQEITDKFNTKLREEFKRDVKLQRQLNPMITERDELAWLLTWMNDKVFDAGDEDRLQPSHVPAQLGLPGALLKEQKQKSASSSSSSQHQEAKKQKKKMPATATNFYTEGEETTLAAKTDKKPKEKKKAGGKGRPSKPSGGDGAAKPRKPAPYTKDGDTFPCLFCKKGTHAARECDAKMKPQTIFVKVYEFSMCSNCLRENHALDACPYPSGCSNCKERHHLKLHGLQKPKKD